MSMNEFGDAVREVRRLVQQKADFQARIEELETIVRYVAGERRACCSSVALFELEKGCVHDRARNALNEGTKFSGPIDSRGWQHPDLWPQPDAD